RVMAATGRSGVALVETKLDLYLDSLCLVKAGQPLPFDWGEAIKALDRKEVSFVLDLNLGNASAAAWGCDLSEEYVKINSQYTT
ncbi:MAG: bifunctional ornithine acetyltransferase/N-acetylglutamate synthase, partial [Chloroflexota bacterium]